MRWICLLLALCALGGCAWLTPALNTPLDVHEVQVMEGPSSTVVVGRWMLISDTVPLSDRIHLDWLDTLGFTPALHDWAQESLAHNPDVEMVAARSKQAAALAGAAWAPLLPTLGASADATRGRTSPALAGRATGTPMPTQTTYGVGLRASWELDLFGRLNAERRGSWWRSQASAADVAHARLSLVGQVIRTYVTLLAATHTRLALEEAVAAAYERERLLGLRYAAGDIDVTLAQAATADAARVSQQYGDAQHREIRLHHAMSTLLGRPPALLPVPPADMEHLLDLPAPLAPPEASTVLISRPDVQASMSRLRAALEDIGASRAAFLPQLNLAAAGGFSAPVMGDVFEWNNRTWSAGPLLTLPLFSGGALRANLKRTWAAYDEEVARYRGVILSALSDVANAWHALRTSSHSGTQANGQSQALASVARALHHRYDVGDVALADVKLADMNAALARANAAERAAAAYTARVDWAVALGGADGKPYDTAR